MTVAYAKKLIHQFSLFLARVNRSRHFRTALTCLMVMWNFYHLSGQSLKDMKFELLDEMNGLSSHWVVRSAIDSNGFLWVGTRDGLNRYDGFQFKVYKNNPSDSSSLQKDHMQFPYVDKKGRVWIGYFDGGLSLFNEECQCFTNFYPDPNDLEGLPKTSMRVLYSPGNEYVFLLVTGHGLGIFNISTKKYKHIDLPGIGDRFPESEYFRYNTVLGICEAGNDLLWMATADGLYKFDSKLLEFISYEIFTPKELTGINFMDIMNAGDTGLWIGTYGAGLCYFDIDKKKFSVYKFKSITNPNSFGNLINEIAQLNEYELLFASPDEGLGIFDTRNRSFTFLSNEAYTNNNLNLNSSGFVEVAKDHTIFAAIEDGLLVHKPSSNLFHFDKLKIENEALYRNLDIGFICRDHTYNCIYFAVSAGNGFNVLDLNTGKTIAYPIDVNPSRQEKYTYLLGMVMQKEGPLWLLTRDYLYEYNRANRSIRKLKNVFQTKEEDQKIFFRQMKEDPQGNIWMLSQQGGLHKFDPLLKKFSPKINSPSSGPNVHKVIQHFAFDKANRIWLFSDSLITCYDISNKTFLRLLPQSDMNLLHHHIHGITGSGNGDIYLSLWEKGILRIDNSNPQHPVAQIITKSDGLISDRIFSMGDDYNGNIWMSSPKGVIFYDTNKNKFKLFNQASGMYKNCLIMEFLKSNDETKEFYIANDNNYCLVDFNKLNKSAQAPKVYITNYRVLNQERPIGLLPKNEILLNPGENYFSFEFGCIDFQNQLNHSFSYMLEGWDLNWIPCGKRRFASYTNLNGGKYTFKVKAANGDGIWSDTLEIPIFIATPFYKKAWFAGLLSFLFALLIYAVYLYRIRQIEHAEKLKTEFNRQLAETRMMALRAQMNPHFIFNCLNSINRYVIKSDTQTASLYITRFAKLIRLILDNSEHKKVVLTNELEALKLYMEMEALRFDQKFAFDIEVRGDLDTDQIEIPSMLIQPFVENAIWHGLLQKDSAGNLSVKFELESDLLVCTVEDNGIGRKKAQEYKSKTAPTRKSIGMKLTEERLNSYSQDFANRGSQEIIDLYNEDGTAKGTRVILKIPI